MFEKFSGFNLILKRKLNTKPFNEDCSLKSVCWVHCTGLLLLNREMFGFNATIQLTGISFNAFSLSGEELKQICNRSLGREKSTRSKRRGWENWRKRNHSHDFHHFFFVKAGTKWNTGSENKQDIHTSIHSRFEKGRKTARPIYNIRFDSWAFIW